MSQLPKGWVATKFTDYLDVNGGTQPAKKDFLFEETDGYIRLLQIRDFGKKPVPTYVPLTKKLRLCSEEDILIGRYGASLGRICTGMEGCYNVALAKVAIPRLIENRFVKYYLESEQFQQPLRLLSRSAQNGFNKQDLGEFNFPIAPAAEQTRIVEKLDEVLAQVDTIKARLDGIPVILKRFRQSVLAAAVSGKLTEEWRKDNSSEFPDVNKISQELFDDGTTKGNFGNKSARAGAIKDAELQKYKSIYPLVRVGEVSGCIVPNRDKPKTFSGDIPWILTPYLNDQSIELKSEQIEQGLSSAEIELYNARVIPSDSVIMTCVGRLGLSAVNEFKCVINQQLHAFTCGKYIYSRYLAFSIRAMENYFYSAATSTTVQYLNKTACNSMPLPLPSIEEQKEIVRLVDQYFAFADTIEAQVKKAQARVDKLTQSILAKAFRGELVPQDPNDEPADKLLERIALARKEAEVLAKAAKKTAKK